MKAATYSSMMIALVTFAMIFMAVIATPMEPEDEQSENTLVARPDSIEGDMPATWDAINTAALRKLLLQLDNEERLGMSRVSRSWPQTESRGWGVRTFDGRLVRPWRADKRQVRFRQCYFNPISCFRK